MKVFLQMTHKSISILTLNAIPFLRLTNPPKIDLLIHPDPTFDTQSAEK